MKLRPYRRNKLWTNHGEKCYKTTKIPVIILSNFHKSYESLTLFCFHEITNKIDKESKKLAPRRPIISVVTMDGTLSLCVA